MNVTTRSPAPNAVVALEQQSPLWPLQSELRSIVTSAVQSGGPSALDISRIAVTNTTVENLFSQWQKWPLPVLREAIKAEISKLDLSGNDLLISFQSALLEASHWSDPLP